MKKNSSRLALLMIPLAVIAALMLSGCSTGSKSKPSYNITIAAGIQNGSITASPVKSEKGKSVTLTISPDTNYRLKAGSLTVTQTTNDTPVSPINGDGDSRTFTMPASDVIVYGEFEAINTGPTTYSITVTEGIQNGSITAIPTTAEAETRVTLIISPDDDYRLKAGSLTVTQANGTPVSPINGSGNSRTFLMPAANVTVNGEFEESNASPTTYTVTVAPGIENGSITANPSSALEGGETITLTIRPNANSRFKEGSLTVTRTDGTPVSPVNGTGDTRMFLMPAANVIVNGEFERLYTVSVTGGIANGTITASPPSAALGETITLTIAPDEGYQLKSITALAGATPVSPINGSDNTRTFAMPAANVTVNGEFELLPNSIMVHFTGFADETLDLTKDHENDLSKSEYSTLEVTVQGNYDEYWWYVDGELQGWDRGSSIIMSGYNFSLAGIHRIAVVAKKGADYHSKEVTFRVVW